MKIANTLLLLFLTAAPSVHAETLAYESFSYSGDSAALNNLDGGFGFASAWGGVGDPVLATIENDSLLAVMPAPGNLAINGNKLRITDNPASASSGDRFGRSLDLSSDGPFQDYLDAAGNVGAPGKTLFISFILQLEAPSVAANTNSAIEFNVNGNTSNFAYGFDFAIPEDGILPRFGFANKGASGGDIRVTPNSDANLVIIQIEFGETEDTATLWVNDISTPIGSSTGDFAFDEVGYLNFSSSSGGFLDEIRIGTTLDDVVALDGDGDGIPDSVENLITGLDPNNSADASESLDSDSLSNLEEYLIGTDINNADTDGDSASDSEEVTAGTDPFDPQSAPGLLAYEGFEYSLDADLLVAETATGLGWDTGGYFGNVATPENAILEVNENSLVGPSSLLTFGNSLSLRDNPTITASGNRFARNLDVSATGPFADYLDTANRIGRDGTTLYISFLMQLSALPSDDNSVSGIEFNVRGASFKFAIGNDVGVDANPADGFTPSGYGFANKLANGEDFPLPANTDLNFYVAKIDFEDAGDVLSLFINDLNTPVFTSTGDFSFDQIGFLNFSNSEGLFLDEIRVGSSLTAVTPGFISDDRIAINMTTLASDSSLVINFNGVPETTYKLLSSPDLVTEFTEIPGLTVTTDIDGVGVFDVLVDPTNIQKSFYRVSE